MPVLSAIACSLLMGFLTAGTWLRFFVWMAIGLVIYFGYSRTHSRLAREEPRDDTGYDGDPVRRAEAVVDPREPQREQLSRLIAKATLLWPSIRIITTTVSPTRIAAETTNCAAGKGVAARAVAAGAAVPSSVYGTSPVKTMDARK